MTFATIPAVLLLAGIFCLMAYYIEVLRPRKGTLDWVPLQEHRPLTFAVPRHRMERRDALPVLLITALYAFSAFFSLGSMKAPDYRQAVNFADGMSYTIEIEGDPVYVSKLWHYSLLGTGGYNLEVSEDGETYYTLRTKTEKDEWDRDKTVYDWDMANDLSPSYALPQTNNHVFKWTETAPTTPQLVKYLRISGRADNGTLLQLGKLILLDKDGKPIDAAWALADGSQLPDGLSYALTVDDTVPQTISWRNSGYFDEIYHPRTALEHIEGVYPFEITHPPLGKLIIGLGIRMFGMTPFGWRFMGTLFGVGMVPLFYLFLKNIFGKTKLAVCGTILFATEFMHLTQTRIATIDTYGVFFILLSYLFFYRWLTAPATPRKNGKCSQGYGQLALSGLFWGVGCACKWTVIYAGAGLAVLYVIHMVQQLGVRRSGDRGAMWRWLWATLGVSVGCFVVIPVVVYTLSYIPYAQAAGDLSFHGVVDEMWRNQGYMLGYHNDVHSYHPYASYWYQWLVDGRPILYYIKDVGGGMVEKFSAFNNPLTSWLGLLALLTCVSRCFRAVWAKLALMWTTGIGCCAMCWLVSREDNGLFDPKLSAEALRTRFIIMGLCLAVYLAVTAYIAFQTQNRRSGLDVFVSVGFAAQFLPWVCIGRVTFAYHYFPATLFLILAICVVFNDLMESDRAKWRLPVYGATAASAGLYVLFYPYLTGLSMPVWYFKNLLQFLPSWA